MACQRHQLGVDCGKFDELKVLLFSPTAKESAIAGVTELLTEEYLRQGAEVRVIATEFTKLERFNQRNFGAAEVLFWQEEIEVRAHLAEADRIIHQVGDNWEFHAGNVRWLPQTHGTLILHDYFLGNLLKGYLHYYFYDEAALRVERYLRRWVGENLDWFQELDIRHDLIQILNRSLLNEWLVLDADAVVAHSDFEINRLQQACGLPVQVLPLPRPKQRTARRKSTKTAGRERLVLGILGHVNPNRMVVEVIESIGREPGLGDCVELNLIGPIEEETRLAIQRAAAAFQVPVNIFGRVSDSQFHTELTACDAVIVLRDPPLESASASLLDAMASGKPCFVIDHGFYQSIPSDCVLKLAPESVFSSFIALLSGNLEHSEMFAAVGARAATYAAKHSDISHYLSELESVFHEINVHRAHIEAGRDIGDALSRWGGLASGETLEAILRYLNSVLPLNGDQRELLVGD